MVLAAYYLIRPVRDAFILAGHGPEIRSYLTAVQVILLVFVVKIWSYLASKISRHLLITWVTLFFISNLVIFYILHLIRIPLEILGISFYIWVGIFNVTAIAQFWAFAVDIYTHEVGKRLIPLVAFGANFGAFIGSLVAWPLIDSRLLYIMMLPAGGILGICIILVNIVHVIEIKKKKKIPAVATHEKEDTHEHEKPLKKGGGFQVVFKSKYLLYIALIILLLNLVSNTGRYILDRVNTRTATEAIENGTAGDLDLVHFIGKLNNNLNIKINFFAMLIQLLLVSRIFRWFGVRGALLFLPLIALGGYFFLAAGASLYMIRNLKVAENSADYSLMNSTRHALFLVTSREAKYKAKAAIDTFFHRTGTVLSGLIVFLGITFFSFTERSFATFNVVVALLWILLCFLIMQEHKKIQANRKEALMKRAEDFEGTTMWKPSGLE